MKKVFSFIIIAAMALSGFAATTGSYWGAAKSIGLAKSQAFKLVAEYDEDDKTYDSETGVYYFKVSVSRGTSFSAWIEGGGTTNMMISATTADMLDTSDKEYDISVPYPDEGATRDDSIQFVRLASGEWDMEDDDKTANYYITISGNVGESATFYTAHGYKSFVPVGDVDNPLGITFSEELKKTGERTFVEGDFYLKTASKLQAGRIYRMKADGCDISDATGLGTTLDEDGNEEEEDDSFSGLFNEYKDAEYLVIEPIETGYYTFCVSPDTNNAEKASFTLQYQMLPSRTPANHAVTALSAENAFMHSFVPGRKIASWEYADGIIDDNLMSIDLDKGQRWVFETEGATKPLYMAVYDKSGKVIASNRSKDGVGFDLRCAIEATAKATYYVGVCDEVFEPGEEVTGTGITVTAKQVKDIVAMTDEWDSLDDTNAGATGLVAMPSTAAAKPTDDGEAHGPHMLSATDWADTFVIAARKDLTYRVGFTFDDENVTSPLYLNVKCYTLSGTQERQVFNEEILPSSSAELNFKATANTSYYLRVTVADGQGLDYPAYNVYAVAYATGDAEFGILTVNTFGTTAGTWSLDRESVKYPGGSSVLVAGTHDIKFNSVTGFKAPAATKVTVNPGKVATVVDSYYSDTFDPKDDNEKGATSWTLKNTETTMQRTLWENDEEDNFSFTAKDGYYFDFELRNVTGDAVFSITNAEIPTGLPENVTKVSQLALKATKAKYYITVRHGTAEKTGGSYTLAGFYANVGSIKFAKNAISVKENAASVSLTVNRTAKDGAVRVKYGTVAGTAKPGIDYIAQSGELFWANGDNKAKTIVVKLIPDLVEYDEGENKQFSVELKGVEEDERTSNEYPAQVLVDKCVVTLTEAARKGTTVESAYDAQKAKQATVKTENVALNTGTFYGVLAEDGFSLTNGFAKLASITLTASTAAKTALSAKVMIAGKTYTFKDTNWDVDENDPTLSTKVFTLAQKVNNVTYTNTLTVTVKNGLTINEGEFFGAVGKVELDMNVPDSNNKGVQENILYVGDIYRDNSKIQEYLDTVLKFAGYYTVALSPSGVSVADGVPAGNGFITLTIDNKGTVKVAGQLPDGKTKPSISVKACAIVKDATSSNGYAMLVPIYMAKSPSCFGGMLRLYANEEGVVVVDSSEQLIWRANDTKMSYGNDQTVEIDYDLIGGWFDKVVNLQAYYLTAAMKVETADVFEFPTEMLTSGYDFVTSVQPNEYGVGVVGNAFSTDKQKLLKSGKLYDFGISTNACNVQVKLTRATGLVTGSFDIWTENGTAQKKLTLNHNGVLIMSRDAAATLPAEYAVAGYATSSVKVTDVNEETGKSSSRTWTLSIPFNILAEDQGEPDWYAEDWGTEEN